MSFFQRYLRVQGYDIDRASADVDSVSCLSRTQLDEWVERRKREIVKYHYENNPLYREKIGPALPAHWEDLPVMEKSDFQKELASMVSRGYHRRGLYVANTSGSSGHPFFFAKDKWAHARTWALIKQRYGWHNLTLSSKQARFYGIPLERWQYRKEKMKDFVMNRVRFPVFDLSDEVLRSFYERFTRHAYEYIYGYTSSLSLFARYLVRNGHVLKNVCPSLKLGIVTSEVCTDEDKSLLAQAFGVPVVREYGASEVGIISFENAQGEWINSEETLFVEVVDEHGRDVRGGVPGDILVTDLFNQAMPFIRYRIGDVGSIGREPTPGGDSRSKLLRLEGRTNDVIVLPSGRKSPGLTFYYISRSILESSGCLREFIIRQTAVDEFVFDVVSDRELRPEEIKQIQEKMDLYLEPGLRLKVSRVGAIKRPASGKIKHFYSEIG